MIAYFILGLGLFIGLIFLSHWYSRANPTAVFKTIKFIGLGVLICVALFFLFTGRFVLVLAALPFVIPFLLRSRALLSRLKAAAGGSKGQASEVVTRFLRMKLDHDSGDMNGLILSGAQEGSWLSELPLVVIEQLYRVYVLEESKSADLISAYAERRFGTEWTCGESSESSGHTAGQSTDNVSPLNGTMDRKSALEILGLDETASKDDIRDAHRKLMQKLHPDHGGNTYLATQINRAKDTLLKGSG